ncbi:MAG: M48 family metalloprotease [Paracoccaceae bacterium]|nr:M48 family metalloprotease [Paracoccaceae bacterium]
MLKLAPILIALFYGVVMYRLSASRMAKQLDQNSKTLSDPLLNQLTKQMAVALEIPRIKVNIYEVEQVNGLAAPDGRIFITRGFFNKYKNGEVTAEELAGVIAHELGHVALGHSRRRMIDFSGQNAMRTALAMILNRFLPGVGGFVANFLGTLLVARLSRNDEYEADAYAAALLTKAGIGTAPQISLFEKLNKLSGANGAATPAWMLSHPKTTQRIAAIKDMENRWS